MTQNYGDDTLRPVTIKQVLEAEPMNDESDFKIDDAKITSITFVGQIRSVSTQATNHTYRLDDGTGTIDVKQWIDPEEANMSEENGQPKALLTENAYARIFGQLKSFNSKRHVGARPGGVRVMTDYNEVQCHLLEATVVHLQLTRGPPGQKNGATNGNVNGNGAQQQSNDVSAGGRQLPAGLTSAARRVYQCLSTGAQTNEGLHMQDIAAQLGMDPGQVENGGNELVNMGLAYTTVDEQTWAILDEL